MSKRVIDVDGTDLTDGFDDQYFSGKLNSLLGRRLMANGLPEDQVKVVVVTMDTTCRHCGDTDSRWCVCMRDD